MARNRVEAPLRSSSRWCRALLVLGLVAVTLASGSSSPAGADDPEVLQDLQVSHTVVASFDRTYFWNIDKVADETTVEADPVSGIAAVGYTVTATPSGSRDGGWVSSGTISVRNPNPSSAISNVTVLNSSSGAVCSVPYGTWSRTIGAGATVELSYSCDYPGQPDPGATVTSTVTWPPTYATPSTSASHATTIAADDWSITPINDVIDVVDDMTDPANPVNLGSATWNAAGTPTEFSYSLGHGAAPGSCINFSNTAWIAQTNQEAEETVQACMASVPVLDLRVSHTVAPSMDRTYLWEIDKVAEESTVEADSVSGIAAFDYTVTATPSGSRDSGWVSSGAISVRNPNQSIDISSASVLTSSSGAVCTVPYGTWDRTIRAGATVELSYTCVYPGQPAPGATINTRVAWPPTYGTPSTSASHATTIAADDWSITPVNDVVDVVDDMTDPANPVNLGSATWNAAGTPTEFSYSLRHEGIPGRCVDFTNTAWIAQTNQEAEESVQVCIGSLRHEKATTAAELLPDGTWAVSYEIEVFNDSEFAAAYVLTDTLDFGAGLAPVTATWSLEGTDQTGTWTDPVDITTATLADGRVLGGAASHKYTVTVIAEVEDGVVGTDPALCSGDDGTAGGGFLNAATLVAPGVRSTTAACTAPQPSPWTLSVIADPVSGSTVDPGDPIEFTVTATPTSAVSPVVVVIRHDLTEVLAKGSVTGDVLTSAGTTTWDGDVLVWTIGTLSEAATLTFSVVVGDDAWDATLVSAISGTGIDAPTCAEDCATTHSTPVQPVDPPGPLDPPPTDPRDHDPVDPTPGPSVPLEPEPTVPEPTDPADPVAPPFTNLPGLGNQGASGNVAGSASGTPSGEILSASGSGLPRTGAGVSALLGVGIALMAAGASLAVAASRRARA